MGYVENTDSSSKSASSHSSLGTEDSITGIQSPSPETFGENQPSTENSPPDKTSFSTREPDTLPLPPMTVSVATKDSSVLSIKTASTTSEFTENELRHLQAEASRSVQELMSNAIDPVDPKLKEIIKVSVLPKGSVLEAIMKEISENFNWSTVYHEVDVIVEKYHMSQITNAQLQDQNIRLISEVERLEKQLEADPRIMKLLRHADRTRKESINLATEIEALKQEKIANTMEIKGLQDQLQDKGNQIDHLKPNVWIMDKLEKKCDKLESRLFLKENELTQFKEEHDPAVYERKCEKEKQDLKNKVMNFDKQRDSLKREYETKFEKYRSQKIELRSQIEQHLKMIDNLKQAAYKNKEELKNCLRLNKRKMKVLWATNMRAKRCEAKIRQMTTERDITLEKLDNLKYVADTERERLEACKSSNSRLLGTVDKHLLSISLNNKKIKALQKTTNVLKENLGSLRHGFHQLKTDHDELQRAHFHEQKSLSEKNSEISYLKYCLEKYDERDKKKNALIKELNTDVISIRQEATVLMEDNTKLAREEKNLTSETRALRNRINMFTVEYEKLHTEYNTQWIQNLHKNTWIKEGELKQQKLEQRLIHVTMNNINLYKESRVYEEVQLLHQQQSELKDKEYRSLKHCLTQADDTLLLLHQEDDKKDTKISKLISKIIDLRNTIDMMTMEQYSNERKAREMDRHLQGYMSELRASHRRCDQLQKQRDLFGAQLLQKKIELELISKKDKAREEFVKVASDQYGRMQKDIHILKLEVHNLRRKLKISENKCADHHALIQELSTVDKKLVQQRKKKSLCENDPQQNIHRWRYLKSRDISKYELTIKVMRLTKRLIQKTNEITEKDALIQEKDLLYKQLRLVTARRLEPDLTSEMSVARATIRKQHNQLKALTAELKMKSSDVSRCQRNVQELQQKINERTREDASRKRNTLFPKSNTGRKTDNHSSLVRLPPISSKPPGSRFIRQPPRI